MNVNEHSIEQLLDTTNHGPTRRIVEPSDFSGVGAYIWSVQLDVPQKPIWFQENKLDAEEKTFLVMTNDATPDGDFKTIVNQHRKNLASAVGLRFEHVQVHKVLSLGFARGVNTCEAIPEPDIDMRNGEVLISPIAAKRMSGFMDRMEKSNEERKEAEVVKIGDPFQNVPPEIAAKLQEVLDKSVTLPDGSPVWISGSHE